MSIATLARKTRTKKRLGSITCGRRGHGRISNQARTAGFVLNMTGRGMSGIRMGPKPSAKYNGGGCKVGTWNSGVKCGFGCKGCCEVSCKGGQRHTCCGGNRTVSKECRANCKLCWYQGLSQPAPQMSYGVYLARKSSGAYRPSGRPCCDCAKYSDCSANLAANPNRNPNTWKQSPNISAGTIIEKRRLAAIACAHQQRKFKETILGNYCIARKLTAKPPCSYYDNRTKQWLQPRRNPLTYHCTRYLSLKQKGRLDYQRINKNWCETTKAVAMGRSASDQIALRKSNAYSCQCWTEPVAQMTIGHAPDWNGHAPSGGPVWGFYNNPLSHPTNHLPIGTFSGKMNGATVLALDFHEYTSHPSTSTLHFFFELAGQHPQTFIRSISLVASDGQSLTIDLTPATHTLNTHYTEWQIDNISYQSFF